MRTTRIVLLLALGVALASTGWSLIDRGRRPPLPRLRVEVLNGSGEAGLAGRAAQHLRELGQDVVEVDNAEHQAFDRTLLVDRAGKPALSRRLAERLGTVQLVLERVVDPAADVTLVLGRDWSGLELPR